VLRGLAKGGHVLG